jgi:hypothetical protein
MTEGGWTARALLRRFALGSGPLKRGSDRVQFAARLVLVALLVAFAVPIGLAVGTAVHAHNRTQAAEQAASRHRTTALLLEDASDPVPSSPDDWHPARAQVEWSYPGGDPHAAVVSVPAEAEAGSRVHIWVDGDGDVTSAPRTAGDLVGQAVVLGAMTSVGFIVLVSLTYEGLRLLLDLRRSRGWDAEWTVVEPVWRRKVTEE